MNIEDIREEVNRCLNCKNPTCVGGCPISMPIPDFISKIKQDNINEAAELVLCNNYFGMICGMICPHEKQCQGSCIRNIKESPVKIGKIETCISEYGIDNVKIKKNVIKNNIKVAVIGSGPSGLSCAAELRDLGYEITVFEKEKMPGGILYYGIPEYRLPKDLLEKVINNILSDDINIECNKTFGKDVTIDSLKKENYKAIYIATGCEISKILPIAGSNFNNVYGANEFLYKKLDCTGKKVIVIGGGNVAIDCARSANKNNAERVSIIYRKKLENMPANKSEINEAFNEKINFVFEKNLTQIIGENGNVSGAMLDDGSKIDVDIIVMAIGAKPNYDYLNEIKINDNGLVAVDEQFMTNVENVYAGGDLIQNKSTVCMAIKNGKDAAKFINENLANRRI